MGLEATWHDLSDGELLVQGVIGERRRGTVGFELPTFREFLEGKLEEL